MIKARRTNSLSKMLLGALIGVMAMSGSAMAQDSGPITVKDSVALTLKNNPNLKAFQEYRQAAEFDRKRARSGFLPTLTASGGIGFEQWDNASTRPGAQNRKQTHRDFYKRADSSVVLSQNIWDGFAAWSRYRMSDAMLNSAEHRLFDNAEALSLDAVLSHMEIVRQQKMVELSELNVANHKRILGSQIDRQRAGASTRADVTQTQARLARAETSLIDAKLALEVANLNYRNLAGKVPGDLIAPEAPAQMYASLENALANSMTNNSKIMSKRADIDAAFAQKDLDKSAFHPRIYVEVSNNYQHQIQASTDWEWGTAVQLRAQWNLYNGHYDWYNLKGNKARIRQANRELQALRDNLSEETASTWSQWLANIEQVKFYSGAVVYNTQTRDMYLQQFNVGQRSLLDVLDSENELYSTSMQLVTAQMNEVAAQYRLITLGGKLLGYFEVDRAGLTPETDGDDFVLADDMSTWTINNQTYLPNYPENGR